MWKGDFQQILSLILLTTGFANSRMINDHRRANANANDENENAMSSSSATTGIDTTVVILLYSFREGQYNVPKMDLCIVAGSKKHQSCLNEVMQWT
jgi:hypothetical protein